jgi:protein-disulfide isomerase
MSHLFKVSWSLKRFINLVTAKPRMGIVVIGLTAALLIGGCAGTAAGQEAANVPASSVEVYQGEPVGFTQEGYPYMGQPDAPVTLEEYSDFLCPFCGRHFNQTLPTLTQKYIASGQVKYVFRDMPLVSLHPNAPQGHAAARCVAEQGAALFWAMHDQLFKTQDEWRDLPDPTDYLAGAAKKAGADINAYNQCLESGRTPPLVQESVDAGAALGFNGTPSFQFIVNKDGKTSTLVGAYPMETFSQQIDALVAGKEPPQDQEEQAKSAELPLWANDKGLAPDPQRPGFTLAGDPYRGNLQAKLVVVEFSNFQCPSCQKHILEVQPAIDKALVDTGQVLWVFKNLPLRSLPQSMVAAVTAECAGDQGKFWEMHDQLFQTQGQWAVDQPDPILVSLAGQLNLDVDSFSTCFNSRQALERVLNDMYDAQGVVTTTPTFVVLSGGKGTLINGSRPAEEFVKTVQGLLDTANAEDKPPSSQP